MSLLLVSSIYILVNSRAFWIGLCLGIPIFCALFMKGDWHDGSIRRATHQSDESEDSDEDNR